MLLLADQSFRSCELNAESFARRAKRRLGDSTYRSELRGKCWGEGMIARVLQYGIGGVSVLISGQLDLEQAPATEMARIYADRQRAEIYFRIAKVDLWGPVGVLRSRTADGSHQVLLALIRLYRARWSLISRTSVSAGLDSVRISCPPVLDAVKLAFPP
ncbi:hypothetical protein [Kitasatospora sp. NBC_01302]|uniref:hypothetical protein n=1 Tax=Kitasatospora sp. NBC_01302 TaxID=2903575 RepID=UPI002E1649A6|nr:hypothetical protein OG294_40455 [Kitasatospora sp. NBC_01302]